MNPTTNIISHPAKEKSTVVFPGLNYTAESDARPVKNFVTKLFKLFTSQDDINVFLSKHQHLRGFALLNKLLDYFEFTYQVSAKSQARIPAEGRVVIISNYPLGILDGLALLKLVRSIRPDVRVVINKDIFDVEPLHSLFLPVNQNGKTLKSQYKQISRALNNEEAVIIFPAGEIAGIRPTGIKDGKWKTGFLKIAHRTKSPVLPVFAEARNSAFFYALSALYKPFGSMMLTKEMQNKGNEEIKFHIGKPIPWKIIHESRQDYDRLAARFRKHLFRLTRKNKKLLFDTFETVVHPVDRRELKKSLYGSELLGEFEEGKKIFLYEYREDSAVMHEISRLRELTFRTVEEGTGQPADFDKYDIYYKHLVLWDENDLEIIGAYRIGLGKEILQKYGNNGFYTSELFDFLSGFKNYLDQAIELGRSFVQPRYWGSRSLDYLWMGIGAFISKYPEYKFVFGPVSLSDSYPRQAKELIIAFYHLHFNSQDFGVRARNPFEPHSEVYDFITKEFTGPFKENFNRLNQQLSQFGVKVPVLYKQYSGLTEQDGCHFLAFNIDPSFSNCVDSLILVEIDKIKPKKYQRYFGSSRESA